MAIRNPKSIFNLKMKLVVLVLGPHADDIELGCGATLLYLKRCYQAKIHYVVFCDHFATPHFVQRKMEIIKSARMLRCDSFDCFGFEDTQFPDRWREIQKRILTLQRQYKPDLIFAPRLEDNHQDHIVIAEAAIRELRQGQALWHYEIKQFGQDQFDPNIFVDVSGCSGCYGNEYKKFLKKNKSKDTFAHRKVFILQKCMRSQVNKPFLNPELILGVMRFRGMQVSPHVDYAEAFKGRMLI